MNLINFSADESVREMIGYKHRERRGSGGFNRIEKEQMRALIIMGATNQKISSVMGCDESAPRHLRAKMGVRIIKWASCHPDRPLAAKGMCRKCYDVSRRLKKKMEQMEHCPSPVATP